MKKQQAQNSEKISKNILREKDICNCDHTLTYKEMNATQALTIRRLMEEIEGYRDRQKEAYFRYVELQENYSALDNALTRAIVGGIDDDL